MAWDYQAKRARPFSVLQQRLGRKKVSDKMLRETPVAFLAFDVLYAGGELVMDRPLRERAKILDELLMENSRSPQGNEASPRKSGKPGSQGKLSFGDEEESVTAHIIRAPVFRASSPRNWRNCSPRRRTAAMKA